MNTINIRGEIISFDKTKIMAIINITPDSFAYSCSDMQLQTIKSTIETAIEQGADVIDIGGYSTRPNCQEISVEEEWKRLEKGLSIIRKSFPNTIISVDTFRAEIARRAIEEYGADIINDISGGRWDEQMLSLIANKQVPYIIVHSRGNIHNMMQYTSYNNLMEDILSFFIRQTDKLYQMGAKDIILDPGFGFSKTMEQNYILLNRLNELKVLQMPLLAGLSNKSMLYKRLDCEPTEAENATTAANTLALIKGANILRVHNVKNAKETIQIIKG